ncbi:DUF5666 domain-containing protein [Ferrimicrobium sp.]|uniref:DUF5666 domain-containing protein n=1 Tax=Ferrimicrobium sp. TaxID=2926050 RepID=UPI002619E077|nr:DUF5666 domain-containing protein [Ferrimicrobium sp.]
MQRFKGKRVVLVVCGGLLLAACGTTTSSKATASTKPTTSSAGSTPTTPVPGRGHFTPPAASGQIASISTAQSMQVEGTSTGESTVKWSSSTTFGETVTTDVSALRVGDCVSAFEITPSGSTTPSVRTVTVLPTTKGCTSVGSGAFAGAPGGGFAGRLGAGSGGFAHRTFKSGAFKAILGTVKAVDSSSLSVTETKSSTVVTLPISSSTPVTEHESVTSAGLVVGKCVTVQGTTSSIGVVTARSIAISSPLNGSCSAFGFGGGGFGGGGAFAGGGGFGGGAASA